MAISRCYWEGEPAAGLNFAQFIDRFRSFLSENAAIAPVTGPHAMDCFLRYESLEADVNSLGCDRLWQRFSRIAAKSGQRPAGGTRVADIYAQYPGAIETIETECEDLLRHGAYPAPRVPPNPISTPATSLTFDRLFTVTAGRTATAWLSRLLETNFGIPFIHEPLGISDFGRRMPDIGFMRGFNVHGMDRSVRRFWADKLAALPTPYIETNHTLAKCGLVEAIAGHGLARRRAFIVLRRDPADQCVSYILRGDFQNITIEWQWYLSPTYSNLIVNPQPL